MDSGMFHAQVLYCSIILQILEHNGYNYKGAGNLFPMSHLPMINSLSQKKLQSTYGKIVFLYENKPKFY